MEVISRKEMQLETKQKHLKQQLEKEYKVEKKRNENYQMIKDDQGYKKDDENERRQNVKNSRLEKEKKLFKERQQQEQYQKKKMEIVEQRRIQNLSAKKTLGNSASVFMTNPDQMEMEG